MTTASKRTVARKPAAAKKPTAARKATARKPRTVHPMTAEIRELAAAVLALASEKAMASEKLGVTGTTMKELGGRRQGMTNLVKLDNGTRIAFTVVVR
jgi:hypothetical protein